MISFSSASPARLAATRSLAIPAAGANPPSADSFSSTLATATDAVAGRPVNVPSTAGIQVAAAVTRKAADDKKQVEQQLQSSVTRLSQRAMMMQQLRDVLLMDPLGYQQLTRDISQELKQMANEEGYAIDERLAGLSQAFEEASETESLPILGNAVPTGGHVAISSYLKFGAQSYADPIMDFLAPFRQKIADTLARTVAAVAP